MSTIALFLLIPYFAWGIYALRLKYQFHEDLSLATEAFTLLGIVLFYALEISVLREALADNRMQFTFATLGLMASGAALYGHMAISFSSRLIVEAVVPGPNTQDHRPRLGPAEALERRKDLHGALQEYMVIARTFPKDFVVPMRIANIQVQLGEHADAANWLERAQKWAITEDQALAVAQRLVEVHERHLKQPEQARAVLAGFLEKFPACKETAALHQRMETIGATRKTPDRSALNALADAPVDQPAEAAAPPDTAIKTAAEKSSRRSAVRKPAAPEVGLTSLDDTPLAAERWDTHVVSERAEGTPTASLGLVKLEESLEVAAPEAAPTPAAEKLIALGLEAMDDAPASPITRVDGPGDTLP